MAMAIKKKNRTLALVEEEKSETTIRKQVGLLGGAFNPVHITHLIAADQVGRGLGLEKVFLMPSFYGFRYIHILLYPYLLWCGLIHY